MSFDVTVNDIRVRGLSDRVMLTNTPPSDEVRVLVEIAKSLVLEHAMPWPVALQTARRCQRLSRTG